MDKTSYKQQLDLIRELTKEPDETSRVRLLRQFLVNHGYEKPDSSESAIAALRARLRDPV